MKANDIARTLRKGPTALYPMIIVAFIAGIIALTIAVISAVFLFQQLRQEHHRSTLAMIVLGKMCAGSDEFALKIIDEMRASSPADVLVSEFTSDIKTRKRAAPRPASRVDSDSAEKPAPAKVPAPKTKTPAPARRSPRQPKNPIIFSADSISYF